MTWMACCYLASEASALPAGREYEMVSPVFKDGFGANQIEAVAPNGESVAFHSPGAFAGAPSGLPESQSTEMNYLARRGASGWSTVPLIPPAQLISNWNQVDISRLLDTEFVNGNPGPESQNTLPAFSLLVRPTGLPDTIGAWELIDKLEEGENAVSADERAASTDFCHLLLESATDLTEEARKATNEKLYELDRGCAGGPKSIALVGVDNKGEGELIHPECEVRSGVGPYSANGDDTFNAMSADGNEVFFTVCLTGNAGSPTSPHQLFMRLGGKTTVEVSRPLAPACESGGVPREVPCAGALERGSADFAGASEDGSKVYFGASLNEGQAPLVPGDADRSTNLYVATIGCSSSKPSCATAEREVTSLSEASHDQNGGVADVQGVLRVAPDGERAYFVAGGDLLSDAQRAALEGEGRPVPHVGADNLYVYDKAACCPGTIGFVGDLCSGKELSGSVEDIRCPSTLTEHEPGNFRGTNDKRLWSGYQDERGGGGAGGGSEAQTASQDGRYLIFATYAQLTGDDTNSVRDVYRYDAQTGALERISTGEDGYDANGNGGSLGSDVASGHHGPTSKPVRDQYELDSRASSEDGSRIVFKSAEPLSPAAINGLSNAYEWHEGAGVSLISSGNSDAPVIDVVISETGNDVFFDTTQGLVKQDTDGSADVYDAHLGTGFPEPSAERRPCEGDACQGPLTNPAPLLVPGSVAQTPGGNFAVSTVQKATGTGKKKTRPRCAVRRKRGNNRKCAKARKRASRGGRA
jgi:hypothetical protein